MSDPTSAELRRAIADLAKHLEGRDATTVSNAMWAHVRPVLHEVMRERHDARTEAERLRTELDSWRAFVLAAARTLWNQTDGRGGDVQEHLHSALGIEYDDDPHEVPDVA